KAPFPGNDQHSNAGIPKDAPKSFLAFSEGFLSQFPFRDVLSGASERDDASARVTLRFAASTDPTNRAVRPQHLDIEFIRCASAQRFLAGDLQLFPAFGSVELRVFFTANHGRVRIPTSNSVEFFGPGDQVSCSVPMPTAHPRHALRLAQFSL